MGLFNRQKPQAQARVGHTPYYPMMNYRGLSAIPNSARLNGEDIDNTPRQFRRNVNASGLQDVQIGNGLRWGVGRGNRNIPGLTANAYLLTIAPIIPGQQRGDAGGFHKRGPSTVAGNQLYNPMSG